MADNDLEIRIGASLDGLEAGTAAAKAQLQALSAEAKNLASQMIAAGAAGDQSLASALKSIKSESASLSSVLATSQNGLKNFASEAMAGHVPLSTLTQEARALVDELASGRLRQASGTAIRTLATIGSVAPMWAAAAVGIGAVGLGLYEVVKRANEAEKALVAVQYAAAFSGQNVATDKMQEQIAKTQQLADVTTTEAGEIVSAFAHMTNGSAELTDLLMQHLDVFSKEMGEKPVESAKRLASMFNDAASPAMRKFIDSLRGVAPALTEEYQAAIKSGDAHRTQVAAMNVLIPVLERANTIVATAKERQEEFNQAMIFAGEGAAFATPAIIQIGTAAERTTAEMADLAKANKDAFASFAATASGADTIIHAATEAGDRVNTLRRQMETADTERNQIVAGIAEIDKSADAALGKKRSQLVEDLAAADERIQHLKDQVAGGDIISKTETAIAQVNATWSGSTIARLHAEEDLWQKVATGTDASAKQRAEATRRADAIEAELRRESQRAELAGDDNAIASAKRGSEEKIAAATKYWQDVKRQAGEGSAEEISAYRKVIEARNEASSAGETDARKDLSVRRDAAANALEAEMQRIRQQADLHEISRQQELAALLDFQRRKDAIENKGTGGKELSDLLTLEEGRLSILQTGSAKEAAITKEVTEKIQSEYKQAYEKIATEAGSDLNSIIWGHETLQQAALKFAEQMTGDWITQNLKKLANSVATTQAQIALNNLMAPAAAAQATSAAAAAKPGIIAQINADAGEAYAGFVGFLAPTLGPGAIAAAAGLTGSVQATALGMASFDTGSWSIPHDMVAGLHAGEVVIPQRGGLADGFRQMAANGGFSGGGQSGSDTHVHFTVNAIDAQGVAAFLQANGQQIAATVAGQQNANPSLRGKW